jgi:uncharacterized protein YjbI with pentapeptide repeats
MADDEQLKILRQGGAAWNKWREENPGLSNPNLRGADLRNALISSARLSGTHLSGANLSGAYLMDADLSGADLNRANLSGAHLNGAHLIEADLIDARLIRAELEEGEFSGANLNRAQLSGADLKKANLSAAYLNRADLSGANLTKTNLSGAVLTRTNLRDATLTESRVYGVSVWGIEVNEGTKQQNLIIADSDKPVITVDNIEVAQFMYLLLNNQAIRKVIDTITSKAVLILGRFSDERKPVLDAIREELRKHNYLPILFDFSPSPERDTVETVKTLAGMARFIIADLTDAKSVLQELQAIVPDFPSVAVRFLIKKPQYEPGMLDHIRKFPWVIGGAYEYEREEELISSIKEKVLGPAEAKVQELRQLH